MHRDWTQPDDNSDILLFVAAEIVSEVRASIFKELGYTCSAGIASNKTLAKLVSAIHKPNKQTILCSSNVEDFMEDLPYTKIRGLGGKLGAEIESIFHVETAGQLWKYALSDMQAAFGEPSGSWLYHIVRGHCTEEGKYVLPRVKTSIRINLTDVFHNSNTSKQDKVDGGT